MHCIVAFFVIASASIGPMGLDAPAREPQLAVSGSTAVLAFGAGNSIYFARSADSGKTFAAPVRVGGGAVVPLTRHRGPRIVFAGNVIVITAVAGKTLVEGAHSHGLPSDGDLIAWRSTDAGKTWSLGTSINDVPGAASEGLHALAADGKGHLFAAWLDKRGSGTQLYGARSDDGGVRWSKNILIYASPDGSICQCCHPSVAFDRAGNVVAMWRNWLNGSRDMYIARASGRGGKFSAPQKLGEGTWKLNACPMDGGGVAVTGAGLMTAWRREHVLLLAEPGKPEVAIGEGSDVAIAPAKGGVYTIWTAAGGIAFRAPGDTQPRSLGVKGAFPAVEALTGGGALAAWESDGRITVQALP